MNKVAIQEAQLLPVWLFGCWRKGEGRKGEYPPVACDKQGRAIQGFPLKMHSTQFFEKPSMAFSNSAELWRALLPVSLCSTWRRCLELRLHAIM